MTTTRGQESWLSVQDASAMLGVSPATLRRWSAAGEVEAFTTPGGHRRFARATLEALLPHGRDAAARPATVGASPARMIRVLRRHARAAVQDTAWLRTLTPDERAVLARLGCNLAEALVTYLDAAPGDAAETLREAEDVAAEHARTAARLGAGLSDLVAVFVRFRALFVEELAAGAVRHGLGPAGATALVTRGGQAADRALAALVSSWEAAVH